MANQLELNSYVNSCWGKLLNGGSGEKVEQKKEKILSKSGFDFDFRRIKGKNRSQRWERGGRVND